MQRRDQGIELGQQCLGIALKFPHSLHRLALKLPHSLHRLGQPPPDPPETPLAIDHTPSRRADADSLSW